MGVIRVHPDIKVILQLFDKCIYFLSESNSIELILHGSVETLTNVVVCGLFALILECLMSSMGRYSLYSCVSLFPQYSVPRFVSILIGFGDVAKLDFYHMHVWMLLVEVAHNGKLVQIVRHAAELADIARVLQPEPFLHLPVLHATAQELPGGYAHTPCLVFQRVVVRCRHLHREAVFQLVCRSFLGATSLVSSVDFSFPFH